MLRLPNTVLRTLLRFYVQHSPFVRGQGRMVHGWRALWAGQKVIARIPPGVLMRLSLDDLVQREIFFTGAFEPDTVRFVSNYLRPGMRFLDIGANVGQFTLIGAALVGATGHVHAFEPSRLCYEYLSENIRLNNFSHVAAERLALSDRVGKADFYAEERENWGMSSLTAFEPADTNYAAAPPQVVSLTTLDAYVAAQEIERIDLIKMDAEGAELSILRGAHHTLSTCPPPRIVCELNFITCRRSGYHPRDIIALLAGYGYCAFPLNGSDSDDQTPLCPLDALEDRGHVDAVFVRPSS